FLADVRNVATRAFAVRHYLEQAAADRASQDELEPAFPRLGLVARLPGKAEVSARRGARLGLQVPAAGPRPGVLPDHRLLSGFGWRRRAGGKEPERAESKEQESKEQRG